MSNEADEKPAALAGLAMTIAREHQAQKNNGETVRPEPEKGTFVTVIVVVAVLVLTLALMLYMNAA